MGHTRRKSSSPLLNMDTAASWLPLAIAVFSYFTLVSSSEPRVVCYYTNWSVYRPGTARFNPQNINPYLCTHLVYAFGGFTKENALKPFDKYQDIEKGGYAKFTGLKTYNKNLKTLLAIGGWNEGSTRFSPMVASRDRRKEFVLNAIKFLRQNRFDGLDLDWEYPAFRDGGKPKDRDNYAKLVKELREEFERESQKSGKPRLLLTMAVPAGIEYIQKGFDVKTLNRYLDWMNLLTYDYHSAFEPAVNHHAPLYPIEEQNEYSVDNELNIDYTIKYYLENGADRDKLVLGIPTYGRSYTLFNADATELGSPADGPGEQGDATREKGYLAYYEICEALKPKEPKRTKRATDDDDDEEQTDDEESEEQDQPWTVVQPNPKAMGPFAFKGNQWVGYDDVDIVKKKAEYVADNGLGGIMFWSIDNDDFRGNCHGKPYPLIEAAKEAYINKIGSTDNVVVASDAPKAVASQGNRRRNRPRPSTAKPTAATKSHSNQKNKLSTTTPSWTNTPEPPTTPDPGSDFKCTDEGFFDHPRDCKKYFWCLDSGPSNLGIVAHQFTCPSGLFFNKAADSCDFARNVHCKKPAATTKAPVTKAPVTTTTEAATTTRKAVKLSTKSSLLFRTTTTTTTPEPELEEEYDDDEDTVDVDAEDPRVIKELIDLIKKVGGVEQLEKQLHLSENGAGDGTTTHSPYHKKLYQKVLERSRATNKIAGNSIGESLSQNSRRGPQNEGIETSNESQNRYLKKDRPQYKTIVRNRGSSTTEEPLISEGSEIEPETPSEPIRGRASEVDQRVGTTTKPLQYVNIRRARPSPVGTSDTADDTASRNALFERAEPVTVSESASSNLEVANSKRDNGPEYVTIKRQRPSTTEEPSSENSDETEEEEDDEASLETVEKEVSSPPSQPQYSSIVRSRSTTLAPEEPSSQEPTTVLAVQITSLLNSPAPVYTHSTTGTPLITDVESTEAITTTKSTTAKSTTTAKTTTAASASTRRTVVRRRGSTTTTTASPVSTTKTTQTQSKRHNFIRRTKPTPAPTATTPQPTADPLQQETTLETTSETPETITKYTRHRGSFKTPTKKDAKDNVEEKKVENGAKKVESAKNDRPPSLKLKNEPRPFRRRNSGANATTTIKPASSSVTIRASRPFRLGSRPQRKPFGTTTSTTTEEPTTLADEEVPTTVAVVTSTVISEESLQDIEERESIEDPGLKPRIAPSKKTVKIQRRPLTSLSSLREIDQNPSATNEERKGHPKDTAPGKGQIKETNDKRGQIKESSDKKGQTAETGDDGKRHSKKFSASIKQNELNEIIKQSQEVEDASDVTTMLKDSEAALALVTQQLLAAPLPIVPNYDTPIAKPASPKTHSSKILSSTQQYLVETSTKDYSTHLPIVHSSGLTGVSYSSTPIYKSSSYTSIPREFSASPFSSTTGVPKSSAAFSAKPYLPNRPSGFTSNVVIGDVYPMSPSFGPSTARLLQRDKFGGVPIEDFGYSTDSYVGGLQQEPAYFTREYLLESPVTKSYDDNYQYLSPITTPRSFTTKPARKVVHKKISTTLPPTTPSPLLLPTTAKPVRSRKQPITTPKPFAKIKKTKEYRPIENYDYYDDTNEKLAGKYLEGTKVIVHAKGAIECLDIGNFPHPVSCKKFIQCAERSGRIVGWEYICPSGLSFDPVGGMCNWSAGLGCEDQV